MSSFRSMRLSIRFAFAVISVLAVCFGLIANRGIWVGGFYSHLFVTTILIVFAFLKRREVLVRLTIIPALTIPVFGLLAFSNGHPVTLDRLSRVTTGMTHDQVRRILGRPHEVVDEEWGEAWVYSGWTWCYVHVDFSSEGEVIHVEHDH